MISQFSARTQTIISEHERVLPGTAGFLSAIDDARQFCSSLSSEFTFDFHLVPNPKSMGGNVSIVFPRLLAETEGWLGCITHSTAFRLEHYLDDIVTGLNESRPYRVVNAARSLLELAAFTAENANLVTSHAKELFSQSTTEFTHVLFAILSILRAAARFAQVTRFNWDALVRGDMEELFTNWQKVDEGVKAPQILTLIDKLPSEQKRGMRFYYDMLCDFVHPNRGAHNLVIDKAKLISNNKMCWRLNLNPSSEEATSVLFHIIAIPVRQSVRLLINDLTRLQGVRTAFIDWGRRIEKMA